MNWLQKIAGYYSDQRGYWWGYWIAPDGQTFQVDNTHHSWVEENKQMLLAKYNLDWDAHWEELREEKEQEIYAEDWKELVKSIAFKQDIPEDKVEITDEQEEDLRVGAQESVDMALSKSWGLEICDFLIANEWIRVAIKSAIQFEGEENSSFYERCTNFLRKYQPNVFDKERRGYRIVVNSSEISSGNLQDYESLEAALSAGKPNGYYRIFR